MSDQHAPGISGSGDIPSGGFEVARIGLSVRAVNGLLRAGLTTIAAVNGVSDDHLLGIRAMGVGTVAEIRRRLAEFATVDDCHPATDTTADHAVPPSPRPARSVWPDRRLLLLIGTMPLGDLDLATRTVNRFSRAGWRTVADLYDVTDAEMLNLPRFGVVALEDWQRNRDMAIRVLAAAGLTPPDGAPQPLPDRVQPLNGSTAPDPISFGRRKHRTLRIAELALPDHVNDALATVGIDTIGDLTAWEEYDLAAALEDPSAIDTVLRAMSRHGMEFRATCYDEAWQAGLKVLVAWVKQHGTARVPRQVEDYLGYRLGQWTMWVRQKYKDGKLDPARVYALEQLPGWYWNRAQKQAMNVDAAEATYAALAAYAEKTGHAVPDSNDREAGLGLRDAANQVRDHREALPEDLVVKFDALPRWTWSDADADATVKARHRRDQLDRFFAEWKPKYDLLAAYAAHTGSASPRIDHTTEDGFWLGGWVVRQRQRRDRLQPRQVALLDALPGWYWDGRQSRSDREWEAAFDRLTDYVDQHGTAAVPLDCVTEDGFGLGAWVRRQAHGESDYLDEIQRELLEMLPDWQWLTPKGKVLSAERRARYEQRFEATTDRLAAYVTEYSALPTGDYREPDGFGLGHWVIQQRRNRRLGTLPEHRSRLLESRVPGWTWDVPVGKPSHRDKATHSGVGSTSAAPPTPPSGAGDRRHPNAQ